MGSAAAAVFEVCGYPETDHQLTAQPEESTVVVGIRFLASSIATGRG
jgi:hypothetical protein